MEWKDSKLTEQGIKQAQRASRTWAVQLKESNMPAPESYYTSPLIRCCETAQETFSSLDLPQDRPFRPVVKEVSADHPLPLLLIQTK